MRLLLILGKVVLASSVLAVLLILFLGPLLIWLVALLRGKKKVEPPGPQPYSVSLIIVGRNAESTIAGKIENSLSLCFPSDDHEIIFFSDGSTDDTVRAAGVAAGNRVRVLSTDSHEGKNSALNAAVGNSTKDILVLSDVDAKLAPDAILKLVSRFADPGVGGVCGQMVVAREGDELNRPQSDYLSFDTLIKSLESRAGSLSSNTGTLYGVRRELFQPLPPGVTDDLYACLSVVHAGRRFVFEPSALVHIRASSRNPGHEIERRRRIVCCSLRGIFLMKSLLNPFAHGIFSFFLLVNKVLRRALPFFMITLLAASLALAGTSPVAGVLLLLQAAFYALALAHLAVRRVEGLPGVFRRLTSLPFYFCLGNYGAFLGVLDFLRGRQVTKWGSVEES